MDVEKIVREYIDKSIHMSLGTSKDNKPWVCEVHFVYDEQLNLYFRSLKSRRHSQEIALNPNVAGNIVAQHSVDEYPHAIYFEGIASIVTGEQERQKLFPLFQARLGANEGVLEEAKSEDGHQFYKVTVSNWYAFGKFGQSSGQKYELSWNNQAEDSSDN
jgi:uncharacterized protein YhbP (UPF0306 family)